MAPPPLLKLASVDEYKTHYEQNYCRSVIMTHDGVRVYFKLEKFAHAFFESTNRDGKKDLFSTVRAERIDWIRITLEDPTANRYQGWNKKLKLYEPHRRVEVVHGDFVVVLQFRKARDNSLRAEFVTCYEANNSIAKIKSSPKWNLAACIAAF